MRLEFELCRRESTTYLVRCIILEKSDLEPVSEETTNTADGAGTRTIVRFRLNDVLRVDEVAPVEECVVRVPVSWDEADELEFWDF